MITTLYLGDGSQQGSFFKRRKPTLLHVCIVSFKILFPFRSVTITQYNQEMSSAWLKDRGNL